MSRHEKSRPRRNSRSGTGCSTTIEQVETRRNERRDKAQPWILLKCMVLVVLAIIAFSAYAYIGRFLLPGLRKDEGYPFSQATCIGLLVGYVIVLLMFLWTYARIVFTSPGFAVDHVQKTPRPTAPPEPATVAGHPYQPPPPPMISYPDVEAGNHIGNGQANSQTNVLKSERSGRRAPPPAIRPDLQRQPNPTPILRPEYRYCYREGLTKPKRTHHCRACGKCVLAYDHHCPWIGQCVGARNARYFFVFLIWTFIYCSYVLTGLAVSVSKRGNDLDAAQIAVIALAGLFVMFSIGMVSTHARLTLVNQTTVESMSRHSQHEQERALLDSAVKFWDARTRRMIKKRWDFEWGNPDTEGNIWWLGSASVNWRQRMGDNPLGWFLPIAVHNPTGLDYDTNPRFDEEGRPRPRELWPKELQ